MTHGTSQAHHTPGLGPATFDRAARFRTDPEWLEQAWPRARVMVVAKGRTLVADGRLVFLAASTAPDGERYFLGVDPDGVPYFVVMAPLPREVAGQPVRPAGIRDIGHLLPEPEANLMLAAVALANWHSDHTFSPATGRPTLVGEAGWVRSDDTGAQMWPHTDPAMIVLVHDGRPGEDGRCLLGQGATWANDGLPHYSCLAGFVEPGESAEQTVFREVAEEVGVRVWDIRYVASQPWPYPRSLMLGFHAVADPAEPMTVDPQEIRDARWFTRAEIRVAIENAAAAGFGIAGPFSIAYHLIRRWLDGETSP